MGYSVIIWSMYSRSKDQIKGISISVSLIYNCFCWTPSNFSLEALYKIYNDLFLPLYSRSSERCKLVSNKSLHRLYQLQYSTVEVTKEMWAVCSASLEEERVSGASGDGSK